MKSEHVFLVFSLVILAVAVYLVFTLQPACPAAPAQDSARVQAAYDNLLTQYDQLKVKSDQCDTENYRLKMDVNHYRAKCT